MMYTSFFGLNEKPFSITPDPRYLFLSERHAEALAHLLYGIKESGGFIQLTGEVGTGKTTIVRSLLEQLPEDTEVALVLNPRMTPREFLLAICEELHVPLTAEMRNSDKALVDALNIHLLRAHAEGRRVVLIVDEAQNLSPDVLETIRLLTNLETAKQKLLQIILIGQPELRQLLARTDLRQLAQRITGRYHLEPLDRDETRAYIRHRLQVAGGGGEIFSGSAMVVVHRAARGIPRLINVISDRALLGAYSREQSRISGGTARRAAREVAGNEPRARRGGAWAWVAVAAVFVAGLTGLALWQHGAERGIAPVAARQAPADRVPGSVPGSFPGSVPAAAAGAPEPAPVPTPASEPFGAAEGGPGAVAGADEATVVAVPDGLPGGAAGMPLVSLDEALIGGRLATDTETAFSTLLGLWGVSYPAPGVTRACEAAQAAGLLCLFQRGSWGHLLRLQRPAILTLTDSQGRSHQLVLTGVTADGDPVLDAGGEPVEARLAELMATWLGDYLVIWQPEAGGGRTLAPGARDPAVVWLREALAGILGRPLDSADPALYDPVLTAAVQEFQRGRRLEADGIAGARTMIALNTALGLPGRPVLEQED